MAKVNIDIPDSCIDDYAKNTIADLESKLKAANKKIDKLKHDLSQVKDDKAVAAGILSGMRDFILEHEDSVDYGAW